MFNSLRHSATQNIEKELIKQLFSFLKKIYSQSKQKYKVFMTFMAVILFNFIHAKSAYTKTSKVFLIRFFKSFNWY